MYKSLPASGITKSSFRGFLDGAEERDRDLAAPLTEIQHGGHSHSRIHCGYSALIAHINRHELWV